MKFTPKTEQELKAMNLMPEGIYSFEVLDAESQISKTGKDMIKLKLGFYDDQGRMQIIFDYLLEAMAFKLRHFCESTGLTDKYELGELKNTDCIGKCGKAQLVIEKGRDKPEGGQYPDRNSIKDYIVSQDNVEVKKNDFINDEIPF